MKAYKWRKFDYIADRIANIFGSIYQLVVTGFYIGKKMLEYCV